MKFSSREDLEAEAPFIFDQLTDFSGFEHMARRRGVQSKRLDALQEIGPGMSWDIGFRFRGKPRTLILDLTRYERPECLEFTGESGSFNLVATVTVVALSPKRCRIIAELELRPRSLGARLMLQSARLGKGALTRKFAERVQLLARELEARAQKARPV